MPMDVKYLDENIHKLFFNYSIQLIYISTVLWLIGINKNLLKINQPRYGEIHQIIWLAFEKMVQI